MKEYKLVYLNKGFSLSMDKDLEQAENMINTYIAYGWTLQQVISPSNEIGAMIGVFYREKDGAE